jgi:hypothetical protein
VPWTIWTRLNQLKKLQRRHGSYKTFYKLPPRVFYAHLESPDGSVIPVSSSSPLFVWQTYPQHINFREINSNQIGLEKQKLKDCEIEIAFLGGDGRVEWPLLVDFEMISNGALTWQQSEIHENQQNDRKTAQEGSKNPNDSQNPNHFATVTSPFATPPPFFETLEQEK